MDMRSDRIRRKLESVKRVTEGGVPTDTEMLDWLEKLGGQPRVTRRGKRWLIDVVDGAYWESDTLREAVADAMAKQEVK